MSFKRLHQKGFDREHHHSKGQSIGQDARDVEQLERGADFKTDSVGTAEHFND
jgi:hypothetical protein